jgi:hypothetical protein
MQIQALDSRIKENKEIQITNVRLFPTATLTQLTSIKENHSFALRYNTIYNQCVVLLISYMTSSLTEIFKETFKYWAKYQKSKIQGSTTELKIILEELTFFDFNLADSIGDIILKKKNVSFQDMQSTLREFQSFFGIILEKNNDVDNIIFAQASRHAIVHSLSIADEKFINQIKNTPQRTLKKTIAVNDDIQFTIEEINQVIANIKSFVRDIAEKLIAITV